ncbi:methyltransferase type 12 [Clostridia bacterium]|nr:methyltransferase type 12 [Clostridia bacterium]
MNTKDIFERIAAHYDTSDRIEIAKIISAEIRRELKDRDTAHQVILDYGCGTGLVGLALTDVFQKVIFVDTSLQMIEQVKTKLSKLSIHNAVTLCLDLCNEDVLDVKVNYILLSQVLLHVKEYTKLLSRLFALLGQGGRLLIVDFDQNENVISDMVHNGFDQKSLALLLKEIGFLSVTSHSFYSGKKLLMNQDATMFLMDASK